MCSFIPSPLLFSRTNVSEVGENVLYLGNGTLTIFNQPIRVRGTDGQGFGPGITAASRPTVFQESLMRPLDFRFLRESSVLVLSNCKHSNSMSSFA